MKASAINIFKSWSNADFCRWPISSQFCLKYGENIRESGPLSEGGTKNWLFTRPE
jgi:hypothetical protein